MLCFLKMGVQIRSGRGSLEKRNSSLIDFELN